MTPILTQPSVCPSDLSLAGLLRALFAELNARRIRYCVLHSFESLPESVTSDVDIAISPGELLRLPGVLAAIQTRGYRALQCLNYEAHGYYFVFGWTSDSTLHTVAIDFICEHREGRLILTSGDELVQDRRRLREFWIPSAAAEYRYLLSKKVLKGALRPHQVRRIAELANELGPDRARAVCTRLFGKRHGERAAEASVAGTLEKILRLLKVRLWMRVLTRQPGMPLRYHITNLPRLAGRLMRPTGFLIAILGPDGVGKSTLISNLGNQLEGAFRNREVFHWRPKVLFADRSAPVSNPHTRPNFGMLKSVIHLGAHFADYILGFPVRIHPLLARTGLVIFDRYFYDLAADPKRYRYGGPQGLPKALFKAVPSPDLVLVLDAPESVVLSRKTETTAEEIRAGRERYRALAHEGIPIRHIDASQTAEEVAFDACQLVIEFLESRFAARHGKWVTPTALDQAVGIFANTMSGGGERRFAVLPRPADPRWMVPISNDSKGDRLAIYTPYARQARLKKVALSAVMRLPASMWAKHTISIPSTGPLEDLVREIFGEPATDFTISLGTPGLHRNATVQIRAGGRVRGFLKVPLTPEANRRIEHEASVLAQLSAAPSLRPFLPSVLHAGQWEGRFVLLQAPVEGKPGRVRFGSEHRSFLRALAAVDSRAKSVRVLLDEVGSQWESVAHRVPSEDRRIADILRTLERNYLGLTLDCGYSHGDFAPWNIRHCPDHLAVFDWEAAHFDRPHDWDAFHFQTQIASLLGRDAGHRIDTGNPAIHCSYLMYLVHSVSLLLKEQSTGGKDVAYRIQRLRRVTQ